ncbi:MAG: SIS domain-containing protein [Kiritimatiellia bacterium]
MNYANQAREVLDIEIAGLVKARDSLNGSFDTAVGVILQSLESGGKIVISGIGKNMPIGQKIAATLTSTGAPAVFLYPLEAMHGDLGILCAKDVLIALSYSGETRELIELIPLAKRFGVKVIALTGEAESTLAKHSDAIISVKIEREACPFNMAPTTSTTATLAVGDALAMVILEARGFKKEDYALLHPGGAIGKTLLLRASDIMRTGDRIASAAVGTLVKDAVLAMTGARAGSCVVVDKSNKVKGIITDGDLRRHISDSLSIASRTVESIMSPDPITLTEDSLAVDVLALYEKHNIDDLIIVDAQGRLAGLIDIQDLPKLKIL